MKHLFVTGTGTGTGKTLVATILCQQARAAGLKVRALKPVVTGWDRHDPNSDTRLLIEASGRPFTTTLVETVSPWRFAEPISPDMAARREDRAIDLDALIRFCTSGGGGEEDLMLIEGIGGVMTPLGDGATVLDWMVGVGAPVLLVTGTYLGALSHCLTAAVTLRQCGINIAAVVANQSADEPVPLSETATSLARFLAPVPVIPLMRLANGAADWDKARNLVKPVLG